MGTSPYVNVDSYPKQGQHLGKRVVVIFEYDTRHPFEGEIIRYDSTAPFVGVIKLDNGRVVLMTECQYRVL